MENKEQDKQPKKQRMHPLLIAIMVVMLSFLALMVYAIIKDFVVGK